VSDRLQAAVDFRCSQQAAATLRLAAAPELPCVRAIGLAEGAGGRSGASV